MSKLFHIVQPDALFHSLLNTCCHVLIQTRCVTVVNYTIIKVCCLDLALLCQQESVFCSWSDRRDSEWFPVEKMQTLVTLSASGCSPSRCSLGDASASGQSEVVYFLSAVGRVCWKTALTCFDQGSKTSSGQMSESQLVPHAALRDARFSLTR